MEDVPVIDDAYQEVQMSVLVLDHGSTRVGARTRDHQGAHLVKVRRGDRLRERELARKHWRDTDFIGLDIDIRRNN